MSDEREKAKAYVIVTADGGLCEDAGVFLDRAEAVGKAKELSLFSHDVIELDLHPVKP